MEQRKKLRLETHDYSQPGWYFITICTKEKEHLLGTVVGADLLSGPKMQLSQLGIQAESVIKAMPGVDKYVIMPNHVHMILQIEQDEKGPLGRSAPTASVPDQVRFFKNAVTRCCGSLIWQRSYHDHIIRSEAEYLEIRNYIDSNPARWADDCYHREA